jgi:hypothetical protein
MILVDAAVIIAYQRTADPKLESPLIQEIVAESKRTASVENIICFLEARFGAVRLAVAAGLEQVKEPERLNRLIRQAGTCASLAVFEEALRHELPAPPQTSTRGKRRSRKPPG